MHSFQGTLISLSLSIGLVIIATGNGSAHDDLLPVAPNKSGAAVEAAMREVIENYRQAQQAGVSKQALGSAEAVYWGALTWKKRDITICFWNGADDLKQKVEDRAAAWTAVSNLKFIFKENGIYRTCTGPDSADIRISMDANDKKPTYQEDQDPHGDWSEIGMLAINKSPKPDVSMSLSLLPVLRIDPTNFDFHIRHEFGHALGLMHEHQRELCDGWFNIPQIAKDTGWTEEVAKENISSFSTEDLGGIVSLGPYDKDSIMQYNFALNWYLERPPSTNPCERDHDVSNLSPKDIAVVQYVYGSVTPTPAAAAAPPTLPPVASAPIEHPNGWASILTATALKAHKAVLEEQSIAIELSALSAHNIASQLQAPVQNTISQHRICFNMLGSQVCNTIAVPNNNVSITQLQQAAIAADIQNAKASSAFKALTTSLSKLNSLAGVASP